MNWRLRAPVGQTRGAAMSPGARRETRDRAEAAGLELLEKENKARREKTEKLKKLRLERDAAAPPPPSAPVRRRVKKLPSNAP